MTRQIGPIDACVFDAYGTLFDVAAAAARCRDDLHGKADQLADVWRLKQLQYTWLRSLMRRYVDFTQVTGDALDYALAAVGIDDPPLRERLMALYMELDAYPEVPEMLRRLRAGGLKTGILTNGSPKMIDAAVASAGLGDLLDAVLTVDPLGIYKPDPSVYRLALDRFGVPVERIAFMSSNAWDAAAAADFGMTVVWVNRFGQPPERLPGTPVAELTSLEALPELFGV
ncbi:MAG: haloacid dehalogenase type II [Gammaproteobacteria bacterium]|jgi:2-haloacid dehalogenase|nr:haloacid dehalogenase type II [Gammaproteobacteria bacterium]